MMRPQNRISLRRQSRYSFERIPTRSQRLQDTRSRRFQQCCWIIAFGLLLWGMSRLSLVPDSTSLIRGGSSNNNDNDNDTAAAVHPKVKGDASQDSDSREKFTKDPNKKKNNNNKPEEQEQQQHPTTTKTNPTTATTVQPTTAAAVTTKPPNNANDVTTQATTITTTSTTIPPETPPPDCPGATPQHCHAVQCLPSNATNLLSAPTPPQSTTPQNCKLLWMVGFHTHAAETMFNDTWTTHCPECLMYAQALDSVARHAPNTIQPIIVLQSNNMIPKQKSFFRFAQARGASIVLHPLYSFHHALAQYPRTKGSFWAMEAPHIWQQYNQQHDGQSLCPHKVIVTSPHVLFTNPITHEDMHAILQLLTPPSAVAFAQDALLQERISDMVLLDTERMQDSPDHMVDFLQNNANIPTTTTLTQTEWMMAYYNSPERQQKATALPLEWNWKPYWNGTTLDQVKIVHTDFATHSARATQTVVSALETISKCQWLGMHHNGFDDATIASMHQGICCDHGHNAGLLLHEWNDFLQNTSFV